MNLTERQRSVLDLMLAGDTNKAIAYKLSLSEHTVKVHAVAVIKAFEVNSRCQVISRVLCERIRHLEAQVALFESHRLERLALMDVIA